MKIHLSPVCSIFARVLCLAGLRGLIMLSTQNLVQHFWHSPSLLVLQSIWLVWWGQDSFQVKALVILLPKFGKNLFGSPVRVHIQHFTCPSPCKLACVCVDVWGLRNWRLDCWRQNGALHAGNSSSFRLKRSEVTISTICVFVSSGSAKSVKQPTITRLPWWASGGNLQQQWLFFPLQPLQAQPGRISRR